MAGRDGWHQTLSQPDHFNTVGGGGRFVRQRPELEALGFDATVG